MSKNNNGGSVARPLSALMHEEELSKIHASLLHSSDDPLSPSEHKSVDTSGEEQSKVLHERQIADIPAINDPAQLSLGQITDALKRKADSVKDEVPLDRLSASLQAKYAFWNDPAQHEELTRKHSGSSWVVQHINETFNAVDEHLTALAVPEERRLPWQIGAGGLLRNNILTHAETDINDTVGFMQEHLNYIGLLSGENVTPTLREERLTAFPSNNSGNNTDEYNCLDGTAGRQRTSIDVLTAKPVYHDQLILSAHAEVVAEYRKKAAALSYEGNHPHVEASINYLLSLPNKDRFAKMTSEKIPATVAGDMVQDFARNFNKAIDAAYVKSEAERNKQIAEITLLLEKYPDLSKEYGSEGQKQSAYTIVDEKLKKMGFEANDLLNDNMEWDKDKVPSLFAKRLLPATRAPSHHLFSKETPPLLCEAITSDEQNISLHGLKTLALLGDVAQLGRSPALFLTTLHHLGMMDGASRETAIDKGMERLNAIDDPASKALLKSIEEALKQCRTSTAQENAMGSFIGHLEGKNEPVLFSLLAGNAPADMTIEHLNKAGLDDRAAILTAMTDTTNAGIARTSLLLKQVFHHPDAPKIFSALVNHPDTATMKEDVLKLGKCIAYLGAVYHKTEMMDFVMNGFSTTPDSHLPFAADGPGMVRDSLKHEEPVFSEHYQFTGLMAMATFNVGHLKRYIQEPDDSMMPQLNLYIIMHLTPEQRKLLYNTNIKLLNAKPGTPSLRLISQIAVKYGTEEKFLKALKEEMGEHYPLDGYKPHIPFQKAMELLSQRNSVKDNVIAVLVRRNDMTNLNALMDLMPPGITHGAHFSPLHMAAFLGHTAMAVRMHALWGEIDQADQYGNTALHYAAAPNHTETFSKLLDLGATSINTLNKSRLTPLHLAVSNNHSSVTKMIHEKGGNIEGVEGQEKTPLQIAIMYGHVDVAKTLLDLGADITKKLNGDTALHLAVKSPSRDMVKLIANHPAMQTPDANGRKLIEEKDGAGKTAMDVALELKDDPVQGSQNKLLVMAELIKADAKIEPRIILKEQYKINNVSRSMLMWASMVGDNDLIKKILPFSKMDKSDSASYTALHIATSNGHIKAAEMLIEAGANVHLQDNLGRTALHYACAGGQESVITALLMAGAKKKVLDTCNKVPLDYAVELGRVGVLKVLGIPADSKDKYGNTIGQITAIRDVVFRGEPSQLDAMLNELPNKNAPTRHGETLIHSAILALNPKMLKTLIIAGLDVNVANYQNATPLHHTNLLDYDYIYRPNKQLPLPATYAELTGILIQGGAHINRDVGIPNRVNAFMTQQSKNLLHYRGGHIISEGAFSYVVDNSIIGSVKAMLEAGFDSGPGKQYKGILRYSPEIIDIIDKDHQRKKILSPLCKQITNALKNIPQLSEYYYHNRAEVRQHIFRLLTEKPIGPDQQRDFIRNTVLAIDARITKGLESGGTIKKGGMMNFISHAEIEECGKEAARIAPKIERPVQYSEDINSIQSSSAPNQPLMFSTAGNFLAKQMKEQLRKATLEDNGGRLHIKFNNERARELFIHTVNKAYFDEIENNGFKVERYEKRDRDMRMKYNIDVRLPDQHTDKHKQQLSDIHRLMTRDTLQMHAGQGR